MDRLNDLFLQILPFLVFIPAAVICYMPMKNQLKQPGIKIFFIIAGSFCVLIPAAALCRIFFDVNPNSVTLATIAVFFFIFHKTVKTDVSRSLAVYLFSCNLSAFPANFAYTFDAWLHPDGTYAAFSWEAAIFQLLITLVLALILIYPMRKYGSKLIDTLTIPRAWIAMASVTAIFLLLNIAIIPRNYSTLYVGRCFPLYISILFAMLLMMAILYMVFYHIVMEIFTNFKLTERIQFFEMEEKQYLTQKSYIEETRKQRHDLRQSIFTLKRLADAGDLPSIRTYLADYERLLPTAEIQHFCSNNAVNALLNHYADIAAENKISLRWNIGLPKLLSASEPDICSILGNLIENAIAGCMTLKDVNDRYHYLSVTIQNNINLYVVSTNSFNGIVKVNDKHYISTKKSSGGIGIHSVEMIAEKYHGTAHFHHRAGEFYADVILKLPSR